MTDELCPDCGAEIDIPQDVTLGEIISCPDCGLDLELITLEGENVELQRILLDKEDWGE